MSNASPEDFGGLEAAPKPQQDAEKARDRAAKAQARAQRLAKDERKSRKHDGALAALITSLVGDATKERLLDAVLDALEMDAPSHFLIGVVSLTDHELSKFIRQPAGKIVQIINVESSPEPVDFKERDIDPQLQLRMNAWFDDIVTSLFSESSVVATQKFLSLVSRADASESAEEAAENAPKNDPEKVRARAAAVISETFSWFLGTVNVRVAPRTADSYSDFILDEIIKRSRAFLAGADQELLAKGDVDLFGI